MSAQETNDFKSSLIRDYQSEISYLRQMILMGATHVPATIWSFEVDRTGQMEIGEAITIWSNRLEALQQPESNPEDYNY